jgi:salicylate hydroxylase
MSTENSPQKPFTIAIVGGGIGGIALAIALRHQNVPVQVYEAAPAFAEIGAGMAFGPNAIRSMELIDPAIRKAFTTRATKNGAKEDEETWINFRCGLGEPDLIAKVQTTDEDKTGLSSVHRAHFIDELADLIPEEIAHFGKRLIGLAQLDSGKIQLAFEDGTTAHADAVVGCDGVRSRVRQFLLDKKSPLEDLTFSGKYAYRGLIPMNKAKEALGDYLAGNSQMYLGPEGHILTYPIDHGKVMNVIAFKNQDTPWEIESWVVKSQGDAFKRDFEGWGKPVQSILQVQDPTSTRAHLANSGTFCSCSTARTSGRSSTTNLRIHTTRAVLPSWAMLHMRPPRTKVLARVKHWKTHSSSVVFSATYKHRRHLTFPRPFVRTMPSGDHARKRWLPPVVQQD